MEQPLAQTSNGLILSDQDIEHLGRAAKWGRVIAIAGFVMLGFMILFGALYGAFLNKMMAVASSANPDVLATSAFPTSLLTMTMMMIMLVCAAIYFFPLLFLHRFAMSTQRALERMDQVKLTAALSHLKDHFGYIAVLMIITVAFYGLFLLMMLGIMAFIGNDLLQTLPQA